MGYRSSVPSNFQSLERLVQGKKWEGSVGRAVWLEEPRPWPMAFGAWVWPPFIASRHGQNPAAQRLSDLTHDLIETGFCDLTCFPTTLRYSNLGVPVSPYHLLRIPSRCADSSCQQPSRQLYLGTAGCELSCPLHCWPAPALKPLWEPHLCFTASPKPRCVPCLFSAPKKWPMIIMTCWVPVRCHALCTCYV